MDMKSNKMFMTRRKAIAGMLATGAGLSINFATAPFSFAASHSSSAANPTALKMKATIKTSQIKLKTSKIAGKNAKSSLKNYTLKTNTQSAPFAANTTATFTAFPVKTTSDPRLGNMVKGDDGSSFFFVEGGANRIGKITTHGAITEFLLPQEGLLRGIANGPGDTFWFTFSDHNSPAYIGKMIGSSGQVTLYNVGSANDDLNLIDITRGPHDPLWFIGTDLVGCIYPDGQDYTIFHDNMLGTTGSIATGNDGALWFTFNGNDGTSGVARISTAGDLTYYPVPDQTDDIVAGDGNDLWFTQRNANRINRLTTSGQLTQYQLGDVSSSISAPSPTTIARVASGTYAFGALTAHIGSGSGAGPDYMGTINTSGDVTLYQQPSQVDIAIDAVYAGWANEVWFTTLSSVCKFRLNS